MKIGELAARTRVSTRSLRYYDQQGLLTPVRHDNGYREYSPLARYVYQKYQIKNWRMIRALQKKN